MILPDVLLSDTVVQLADIVVSDQLFPQHGGVFPADRLDDAFVFFQVALHGVGARRVVLESAEEEQVGHPVVDGVHPDVMGRFDEGAVEMIDRLDVFVIVIVADDDLPL